MNNILISSGNKFGTLVQDYEKGRNSFSDNFLNNIKIVVERHFKININEIEILDIGCGTGISTRSLYNLGFTKIKGFDFDNDMLETAKRSGLVDNYYQGNVNNILEYFPKHSFQIITAFSAFHWFCNSNVVNQIKELLVPNGIFIVASAEEIDTTHKIQFKNLIANLGGVKYYPKDSFNPISVVESCGFRTEVYEFIRNSSFTLEKLISARHSNSGWCNLTKEQQDKGEDELQTLLHKQFNEKCNSNGMYISNHNETCYLFYK